MTGLVVYLFIINLAAFCMMGVDKVCASRGEWRIPEKTLFLPILLGGGIGGCISMQFFRHKTKHLKFLFGVPFITISQGMLLLLLYGTM